MRYLLGEASEAEASELEERYFADDGFFEHLQTVEDELIDAYVRGSLSPQERQHFEESFLTNSKRRQRVEFAKTLLNTVDRVAMPILFPDRTRDSWWHN